MPEIFSVLFSRKLQRVCGWPGSIRTRKFAFGVVSSIRRSEFNPIILMSLSRGKFMVTDKKPNGFLSSLFYRRTWENYYAREIWEVAIACVYFWKCCMKGCQDWCCTRYASFDLATLFTVRRVAIQLRETERCSWPSATFLNPEFPIPKPAQCFSTSPFFLDSILSRPFFVKYLQL